MDGPNTKEWGPALWGIFHTFAERTGGQRTALKEDEEKRRWRSFLMSLRACIPCPRCKKHYEDYIRTHPVDGLFRLKGADWGIALRQWLWTFHNEVRVSSSQPVDIPFEQVSELYGSIPIEQIQLWKQTLQDNIRKGMFLRLYIRDDMMHCIRLLEELYICLSVR